MKTHHVLLGLLIVAVFAVGLAVGQSRIVRTTIVETAKPAASSETTSVVSNETSTTSKSEDKAAEVTAGMTPEQKSMLQGLGIDISKITPTMIACAETSLGAARVAEVKNGASLSLTEKVKLVACYK